MHETKNLNAVVIDDHSLARAAIKNLLENNGITIVGEAEDGEQALLIILQQKPDIVIIDADIPLIDGISVTEKLRKQSFNNIIIVVSAKNSIFYGKCSADVGANAFISKKEGTDNIISAVKAAKHGYSYFPLSMNVFTDSVLLEQKMLLSLSKQEVKVMNFILTGADNIKIASEMNISNKTVSTYRKRLLGKLNCRNLIDLYAFLHRNNIV